MRICPNCETPTLEPICPYDGYQTVDAALYMDPQQDPFVGTVFHNRYRIESRLAMGGMSTVYRATQLAVGRPVALKIMTRDLARDLKAVARFQQEARAVAGLRHPNTIRLFDYGQSEDGHLFLVMEFLDGEPLSAIIDRDGPFDAGRVIRIAKQLFDALSEAHSLGIVHRDLKPDNVFITNVGLQKDYVKILDFGIAKVTKLEGRKNLTGTGLVIGSPGYMAPEQVQAQPSTAQTDIYAIGALSYEMLTGGPIFEGESAIELAFKHVQDDPPPPTVNGEELQGPLVDFILQCLNKPAEDRPPSAATALQMLQALEAAPLRSGLIPDPRSTAPGAPTSKRPVSQRRGSVTGRRNPTTESFAMPAPPVRSAPTRRGTTSSQNLGGGLVTSPTADDSYPPPSGGKAGWVIAFLLLTAAVGGGIWWYTQYYMKRGNAPKVNVEAVASKTPSVSAGNGGTTPRATPAPARADAAGAAAPNAVDAAAPKPAATPDAAAQAPGPDAAPAASTKDAGPTVAAKPDAAPAATADAAVAKADATAAPAGDATAEAGEMLWVMVESSPKKAKVYINPKKRGGKYEQVGITPFKVTWKKSDPPPRVMLRKYHYEVERKQLRDWHHTKTLKFSMEFDDSW